ncbi:hypothetical protein ExPCM32_04943 [Escherichia coli]|nr:hypothetical protein ExPCM32_04943 [Escherichia coli]
MTSRIAQAGTYGIHCAGVHNVRQLFTGPLQFERQKLFKVIVQRQKFDHLTALNDFTDFHIAFRQFCRQFRLANQHDGQQFFETGLQLKKAFEVFQCRNGQTVGLLNHQNVAEPRLAAVFQDAMQLAKAGVLTASDAFQWCDGTDNGFGNRCCLQGFPFHIVVFHSDDVWLDNNHRRILAVDTFSQVTAQRGFTRTGLTDDGHKPTMTGCLVQRLTHVANVRSGEHIIRTLHGFVGERVTEKTKRFFGCWK